RLRDIETNRRRLHDLAPPNHWVLQRHPLRWHSRADGGAVHSIKTRQSTRAISFELCSRPASPLFIDAAQCRAPAPFQGCRLVQISFLEFRVVSETDPTIRRARKFIAAPTRGTITEENHISIERGQQVLVQTTSSIPR